MHFLALEGTFHPRVNIAGKQNISNHAQRKQNQTKVPTNYASMISHLFRSLLKLMLNLWKMDKIIFLQLPVNRMSSSLLSHIRKKTLWVAHGPQAKVCPSVV